jgi:AcrR family transcriptional regulator
MHRQVRTTPRKQPSQQRSKDTVDAILDATTRVLKQVGFDGLTTNAVAERAGVSIGSVYQYFPNKEALVSALIDRHVHEMNAAVLGELARVATMPVAQAARAVIELTLSAHAIDPALHRVLTEQVPRIGKLAKLRELDNISHRMIAGLLAARRDEIDVDDADLELVAFVLVSTIESIVHRAALLYPDMLRDPRLVDEATRLVTRYLGVPAN